LLVLQSLRGGIPESVALHEGWEELKRNRVEFDATIVQWTDRLDPRWLEGDLTWYSGAAKKDMTKPKWILVSHLFNNQVHCMLTQAGAKPGATDFVASRT
jgi:uncharacterized damage-inducible protein DinB